MCPDPILRKIHSIEPCSIELLDLVVVAIHETNVNGTKNVNGTRRWLRM
jgi:hypothetical protein